MKVYIIGAGMGNPDTLTEQARQALAESDLIVGSPRLLEPYAHLAADKIELSRPADIAAALADAGCATASVLVSGDVGFYSAANLLYDTLEGCDVQVIPGISSLVYFCAKLRCGWQDAELVSAHGRSHNAVGVVQHNRKTFCLTGGATRVHDICAELVERGFADVQVHAGERLSYPDERIVSGTAAELAGMRFADLAVMLVENPRPVRSALVDPPLADSDFSRGAVPMTKQEVRALALSKLQVVPAHTVWDIGTGTGSVAVELARAAYEGRVFGVDRNKEALALAEENRGRHRAWNLQCVLGEAPEALQGLPAPDRVFIGGTSGRLAEIVRAVLEANPATRIVASAVTLETLADALACVKELGLAGSEIVQVGVSRADELGSYHLMRAQNPVYLVTMCA